MTVIVILTIVIITVIYCIVHGDYYDNTDVMVMIILVMVMVIKKVMKCC